MATTIATLAAKLSLDNKAFLAGFRQSISASKGFAASIGSGIAGAVTSMGTGIAASLSLATAINAVSQSMQNVDREAKLADRLGLSNEAMQRMSIIAKAGNVDVETLSKALLTMGRNIGTGGKTLDQRFFDVADAISQIKDPAERSKRAMEVFGKEGNELIGILTTGSRRLREQTQILDRFGLNISRIDAAKVQAANDAFGRMGIYIQGTTNKIATGLAPAMENFANRALTLIDNVTKAMGGLGVTSERVGKTLEEVLNRPGFAFGAFGLAGLALSLAGGDGKTPAGSGTGPASDPFNLNSLDSPARRAGERPRPAALERGSVEAASAIQKAGGDPISALHSEMQKAVRALQGILDAVDPMKKDGRGEVRLAEGAI